MASISRWMVIGIMMGSLAGCGGDDETSAAPPVAAQVPPASTAQASATPHATDSTAQDAGASSPQATQLDTSMRRPLSPGQPMFMIHADTWNAADPQKIIDMIPADIRPYAVLLISMSISHNGATDGKCNWNQVENGIEVARSWIKVAAANGIWAMIQPSSGGFSQFPDYGPDQDLESTLYGEFFANYPNFLGFNYAEQFWGFDQDCSVSPQTRWDHWANLLKLTNKYGGYLTVSFTGGYWGAALNPVAMLKRDTRFEQALRNYSKNFIIEEKYTAKTMQYDMESVDLGMYLSGYAGHYGIRPDRTGWSNLDGTDTYPTAAGSPHLIEHLLLTGDTVVDGPEQIPVDAVKTLPNATTSDGYTTRQWDFFPHFKNIQLDIYRKVLDGTLRILNRQEVIDRTKVVMINDVNSGDDRARYATPETLFSGLYLMDDDGTYLNQRSWFKKTGRYPSIPSVFALNDDVAKSFQVKVNKSAYATRWPDTVRKVAEFDSLFPQEYSGDIYAGRQENTWVTYNPYRSNQTASGTIPFKYNTCDAIHVTYSPYTTGIIKEYPDRLYLYLTNYDSSAGATLRTDVLQISGANAAPTVTYKDRGDHPASTLSSDWSGGTLTLNVGHNGPVEINVSCSGSASNRLTAFKSADIQAPAGPAAYSGVLQYEAENFDFKRIGALVANGVSGTVRNYQGLGYLNYGTNAAASARGSINVPAAGSYLMQIRYALAGAATGSVDLYVNGNRVGAPAFAQTASPSDWATVAQTVSLNAGRNTVEFRSTAARSAPLYLDNIVLDALPQ